MAMTAFYMGQATKRHGEAFIDRVDKNGTEHWVDHNCPKCGGTGYLNGYEHVDGARCWKCGATGHFTHTWTVMTPEYAAKLAAKRDERTRKKNLAGRAEFLEHEGFNVDGVTFVVIGNTFAIKDELKAAGAKFNYVLGWHFADKPEAYASVELTVTECFWENDVAALHWNGTAEIQELIKSRTPHEASASEYLGEVGKKLTIAATLKKSFSFENTFGYQTTTTYIHNFEDAEGNVIIWKTTNSLIEYTCPEDKPGHYEAHPFTTGVLAGTVKEHSEYKGIKQTVLTRCKVQVTS